MGSSIKTVSVENNVQNDKILEDRSKRVDQTHQWLNVVIKTKYIYIYIFD